LKTFTLCRIIDDSGISGTGVVAEGVEFENGEVALHWLGETSSIAIYSNMDEMMSIHGHEEHTKVEFQ
jgi:hypothetical protein